MNEKTFIRDRRESLRFKKWIFLALFFSLSAGASVEPNVVLTGDAARAQYLIRFPEEAEQRGEEWVGSIESVSLREALQTAAIEMEILDSREVYILNKPAQFASDLGLLQRRYKELVDAPTIENSERFPSHEKISKLIKFNREYKKKVLELALLNQDRGDRYRKVIAETDHLYHIWEAVREARSPLCHVAARRQAMMRLIELIGVNAYRAMDLPPSVPIGRLIED